MNSTFNNQDQLHRRPNSNFEIVEEGGITFIEEKRTSKSIDDIVYNPLTYKNNGKMPRTPSENIDDSPQVALANLDYLSHDDILSFVRKWGFLGLQKVEFFEEESFEERKGIQYNDLFRSKRGRKREPLFLFKKAVNRYQELNVDIEKWNRFKENLDSVNLDDKRMLHAFINANINPIISSNTPRSTSSDDYNDFELSVFSSSLYGYIYSATLEGLSKGIGLKVCQRDTCQAYFRPTRSDRLYCSTQCNDAVRRKDQRVREKAIKELCMESQTIGKDEIKKTVKQITNGLHLSKEEVKEKFYAELSKNTR